jgi:hypothetical protein
MVGATVSLYPGGNKTRYVVYRQREGTRQGRRVVMGRKIVRASWTGKVQGTLQPLDEG